MECIFKCELIESILITGSFEEKKQTLSYDSNRDLPYENLYQ